MASALQRQAVRRKVIYAGVIVGLFTLSIFWRGKLAVPFSGPDNAAGRLTQASVRGRAEALELRELDQGDPELLGAILRLTTFGTRGAAVTALWWGALEKQKRHEYHEFQVLVQAVTRLQPNFITPWLYQSWNLSYNVSVEHDKLGDMYYYIARGISLLAEGDRVNTRVVRDPAGKAPDVKVGAPDLRYNIGIYYQNKFSVSDKVSTLRSLMQVSAIPPRDRKRSAFEPAEQGVDPAAFAKFCRENPQLVRRLRNKLRCTRPADVVDFLADNEKVPTIYKGDAELADPANRFPIFPDPFPEGPNELNPSSPLGDTYDAFDAAKAWFAYSLTSVPPNKTDRSGEPLPWSAPSPGEYDQFKYRMPRAPALIVFRQAGPRAQTYLAERLTNEGWFDRDTVYDPSEPGWPNALATPRTAQKEWEKAAGMWEAHGTANALLLTDARRAALEALASGAGRSQGVPVDPQDRQEAAQALGFLQQNQGITNFQYFLAGAKAESESLTVQARRLLYEAAQAAENGGNVRATELYRQALAKWLRALAEYPDFHRPFGAQDNRQTTTEENTYEYLMALTKLLRARPEVTKRSADLASRGGSPGLGAAVLGPLAAAPDLEKDALQAGAEDEAYLEVAVESVLSADPLLAPQPGTPRAQALQEVNKRFDARPKPEQTPAVRRQIARAVVNGQFAWMKEFKYEPKTPEADGSPEKAAYWVMPDVRQLVRERMNLVRRRAPDAPQEGPAPPAPPGAGQR